MIFFKTTLFLFTATLVCGKEDDIIVIGEDNWKDLLKGEWMIEFHAPWCLAWRTLQPVWEDLGSWSDDLGIKVAKVDVTDAPALSGRFMAKPLFNKQLPTIFHAIDGEFRHYKGPRGKDDFITFIQEKKWHETEPLSFWNAPDSIWMSTVAWIFKMSMFLRGAVVYLTEDMGAPSWAGNCFYLALNVIAVTPTLVLVGAHIYHWAVHIGINYKWFWIFVALVLIVKRAPLSLIIVFFIDLLYLIIVRLIDLLNLKTQPKKKAKSDDEKDNEHENKDDVVAEDLIDEAAEV